MTSAVSTVDNSAIIQKYIDSQKAANTKTTTSTDKTSISSVTGDFNTFLKILTTQLQNQDPTSATDPNQFTQELVQFSAVEQQINTNSKLDTLIKSVNSNGITPLLGYVGQYVEAPANGNIVVQNGTSELAYDLTEKAQDVSISVLDSKGNTVTSLTGPTEKGLHRVIWDGKDSTGAQVADGSYTLKISAKTADGKALTIDDTRLVGKVTGVQTGTNGATTLSLGGLEISDTDISAVFSKATTTTQTNTTTPTTSG